MNSERVLVVDDNRNRAKSLAMLLDEAHIDTQVAHSGKAALALMEEREFELVVSHVRMPLMSGLDLLRMIRTHWPFTKVVLLTTCGTIDSAVDAMRSGAYDYLTKPFDKNKLLHVVQRALSQRAVTSDLDIATVMAEVAAKSSQGDLLMNLGSALDVIVKATGADDGEIFLSEPESKDLFLCAWKGPDGEALVERSRFERGLGYPGIVAKTGKPLWAQGNLVDDTRFLRRSVIDAGICSLVATPLPDILVGVLGSIHLMSRRDDFLVERARKVLESAAVFLGNVIRAELGDLRWLVDGMFCHPDEPDHSLRKLLESMRRVAGARRGSLALLDSETGRPNQVVSTGPVSLLCRHAEAGTWTDCFAMATQGFAANPGRRDWPEPCRLGLPKRAVSPCCLPIAFGHHLHGLVILDLGREGSDNVPALLVPLLGMAHQAALRLQSKGPGFVIDGQHKSSDLVVATSPELELRCFGSFTLFRNGQPISNEAFTRSKALTLLKLLALKAGTPLHREWLIELLWPEVDSHQGVNRLHGVVHDLRSVIEADRCGREWMFVRNRGEYYYLDIQGSVEIDFIRFRRLAATCLHNPVKSDAVANMEQMVELYRGDLFEDEPFAEWCEAEREDLKKLYVQALQYLVGIHTRAGNNDRALTCLRRALHTSPFRDDLFLTQLEVLVRLGRINEAIAAYSDYQCRLKAELNTSPSSELSALYQRLLRSKAKQV